MNEILAVTSPLWVGLSLIALAEFCYWLAGKAGAPP